MPRPLPPVLSLQALEYMVLVESIEHGSTTWETELADLRVIIHAAAARKLISVQEWRVLVVRASKVNQPESSY
jgi:hypothetical protein